MTGAEQDGDRARDRLQFQTQLLDAVGQAVVANSPEGSVTYWNASAERLFGYTTQEALGARVSDFFPAVRDHALVMAPQKPGIAEESVREVLIACRDGVSIPVLCQETEVLDEAGYAAGTIRVLTDARLLAGTHEALRASEERFRAMFDQAAVGVAQTELDGSWVLVNDRVVELYGYTREELLSLHFQDLTYPDDLADDLALLTRMLAGEISWYSLEKRFIRKDGVIIWVEVTVSLVRDGQGNPQYTLAVVSDISARKEAEEALRASEQLYRSVVETSVDGIGIIALDGTLQMANPQLADMLGYASPEDMPGLKVVDHLLPEDRERARRVLEQRALGEVAQSKDTFYQVVRKDGTTFPAEVTSLVLRDENGTPIAITSTARDVTEREAYHQQLQHLALHDVLTNLPNRALMQDRMYQVLSHARRSGAPFAVFLLDVDRFKDINDTYGHHVGDEVLRELSRHLQSALRESDTLARLGGDEFVVLLPECTYAGAAQAARKLVATLDQTFTAGGHAFRIAASIGVALFPDDADDVDTLLRYADLAMYTAKESNLGYCIYTGDKDIRYPIRLTLGSEMRNAIESGQMVLHYQPSMRLSTGAVDGMEALVRWNHPQYGLVPPDEFIPLAERSGLIRSLTSWVIREALRQCRDWRRMGLHHGIAVNLSARSLSDPDLLVTIAEAAENDATLLSKLTIEITESVIMTDPDRAMDMLSQLQELGIKVSVDDFGIGYSSLAYLRQLRANELKIDKSFVIDLDSSEDDAFIVRSVVDLGHNLGFEVVAEGVESIATLDILSALRCDRIQGFHLSRPLPAEEMTQWLLKGGKG